MDIIDEALVALDGGRLAMVERIELDGGGVLDRVTMRETMTDDAELAAILAL